MAIYEAFIVFPMDTPALDIPAPTIEAYGMLEADTLQAAVDAFAQEHTSIGWDELGNTSGHRIIEDHTCIFECDPSITVIRRIRG